MSDVPVTPPNLNEVSADGNDRQDASYLAEIREVRDEVLKTHGRSDPAFYESLLRDEQVRSTFTRRRMSVIAREWKVDPGGDAAIDIEAADHLKEQLKNVSWDQTQLRMLAGLMYGYRVAECMWRLNGRLVELARIKVRRSSRFRFRNDGQLALLTEANPKGELMPPRKFWVFTAGAEEDDDPYGIGLGSSLYWPVWFKRNAIQFWSIFLERFATGVPTATVPAGSTEEQRKKFLAMLEALVMGGKIVVPRGVDLNILQAVRSSGGDYDLFVKFMNASISKIVLTQTMTTDDGSSLAQGEVHERGEGRVVKADADLLDESFILGPATWLTEWNFPGAKVPRVYRDFADVEDLTKRIDRDVKIQQLGYRPTADTITEVYGDGYEPAPAPPPPPVGGNPEPAFAAPLRDAHDAVEDLVGGHGWRLVMGPEVDRIERLLDGASSLDEVRDRLGELAMADPNQLVDGLARVLFAARVQGEVGADSTEGQGGRS